MWRKLRKILLWTIGIVVGLVLTLAFIIWLMQDKIKAYAVDYLNEHLKTELKVDAIDVTFLSTFPNVTLHFRNATILDPVGLQSYRDTLIHAKHIYLGFGLWDVLSSNYKAKRLDVHDAYLRAFVNKDGIENYDIVKPQEEKKKEDKLDIDLSRVKIYNTRLIYHNAAGNQQYTFRTRELIFKGKFSSEKYDLETSGDLHITRLRNKNLVLFKNQDSQLDLVLSIDSKGKTIGFKRGDWKIGKMHLGIDGTLAFTPDGTDCNLSVFGKNIALLSMLQLLPDEARKDMDRYKSFGLVNLKADIKGLAGKTKAPDVSATFNVANGILVEKKNNISLHNIDLEGAYTNRNKLGVDELKISKMMGRFKDGNFSLNGKLTDFSKPHIVMAVTGEFGLATLHDFISAGAIKEMKGKVEVDSKLDFVLLRTDNLLLTNTIINEASGKVKFSDATVLISEKGKPITGLNGQLNLKDNDALVDGLIGKVGESDFSINGALKNFTPYFLTSNQSLSVVGAFNSTYCNISDLVHKPDENASEETSGEYAYAFPENINFNFDLNVGKLEWDPFTSTNLRGNFKLVDKKLSATGLNIEFAGGKCQGSIEVDGTQEKGFLVNAKTKIENVQLPLALKGFKNFGQELITPQNAKGILTTDVDWLFPMGSDLKIDKTKMLAHANINIKKGELKEVEHLKMIADFMRTDKKLRLFLHEDADDFEARVRHLKFDDLKNELTVKDGKINIPKMEIKSNAMDISLSGEHSFENMIDYHFNFRYLELKKTEYITQFGEIKDDKTGIKMYIHVFGSMDDPQYAWDKQERKADQREKREQEKQTVKSLLKEEFGVFKKDSTVKVQKTKEEDVRWIMEWDETEPAKNEDTPQRQKDNNKLKRIKKKLGIDENTNKDVKFEIEEPHGP